MDIHDNAGTMPHSRSLMVRWLSSSGWSIMAIAAAFDVCPEDRAQVAGSLCATG